MGDHHSKRANDPNGASPGNRDGKRASNPNGASLGDCDSKCQVTQTAQAQAGAASVLIESQREIIASLARVDPDAFQIEKRAAKPAQSLALVVGRIEIYLPLAGMIDVEKEKVRLAKEIAQARADSERAEELLAGEFSKKAPKEVVKKQRDALAANRERLARLDAQLASLKGRAIAKSAKRAHAAKKKSRK